MCILTYKGHLNVYMSIATKFHTSHQSTTTLLYLPSLGPTVNKIYDINGWSKTIKKKKNLNNKV